MEDIKAGKAGLVPAHLRDGHYSGAAALGNAQGYKYAHDDPDGVVAQQYPPDELVGVDYYRPTGRGFERDLAGRRGPAAGHHPPQTRLAVPRRNRR